MAEPSAIVSTTGGVLLLALVAPSVECVGRADAVLSDGHVMPDKPFREIVGAMRDSVKELRGTIKLRGALDHFEVEVSGRICSRCWCVDRWVYDRPARA